MEPLPTDEAATLAALYDLDLADDPGDLDLYLALAARAGGPIVELCAGTGRVAVPLAAAGHRVTAVDVDPAMVARARLRAAAEGPGVPARMTFVTGDLFDVAVPAAGTFGLGIIALNSLLLLGGPAAQRRAVQRLASLLAPGGIAVIDAWLPLVDDLVRFDGRLGLEWRRLDPASGRTVLKTASAVYDSASRAVTLTTIFDLSAPGGTVARHVREDALHLVASGDLRLYAEDAGLEVEMIAGDYELNPLQPGDGRAVLVARRSGPS